jgi:hypothetical protein
MACRAAAALVFTARASRSTQPVGQPQRPASRADSPRHQQQQSGHATGKILCACVCVCVCLFVCVCVCLCVCVRMSVHMCVATHARQGLPSLKELKELHATDNRITDVALLVSYKKVRPAIRATLGSPLTC